MSNTRCPDCDLTLATEWELENHEDDCKCCELLCWRIATPGAHCERPSVNWRELALSYEQSALHWARAYVRECKRRDLPMPTGTIEDLT